MRYASIELHSVHQLASIFSHQDKNRELRRGTGRKLSIYVYIRLSPLSPMFSGTFITRNLFTRLKIFWPSCAYSATQNFQEIHWEWRSEIGRKLSIEVYIRLSPLPPIVSRNIYYFIKKKYSGHPTAQNFQEMYLNLADVAWAFVKAIRPTAPFIIKVINDDES